jgi:hypothetical protein
MPFIPLRSFLCCVVLRSATLNYYPNLNSPFPFFFFFPFLRAAFPVTRLSGIKLKSMQPTETPSRGSGNRDQKKSDFVSRGHIASNCNIRERHTTHQTRGPPMAMPQEMVQLWPGSRPTRALAYFLRLRTAESLDVSRLPTKSKCDDQ